MTTLSASSIVAKDVKVSVNVVRAIVDTAEREGLPRARLLEAAHVDPILLELPTATLSRAQIYELFEAALDLSDDSTAGLYWGSGLQDQALSVVAHLVKHATTLRDAFEALMRFSRLLTDEPGTRLTEQGGRVTLRCLKPRGASPRVERCLAELTLAGLYRLIQSYSSAARVEEVNFEYAAPSYRNAYTRVFDAAERFDQPFTGMVFNIALLDAVSPYKDEDLHGVLRALAERRLMQMTHCTPYSVRARDVLLREEAPQNVPMADVARKLDMSVRSLRRRLSEEGKSYRDVANDACTAVATRMIADERRTIQETAYCMGFSDANAFHRAFKRWTGTTPSEYRDHAFERMDDSSGWGGLATTARTGAVFQDHRDLGVVPNRRMADPLP